MKRDRIASDARLVEDAALRLSVLVSVHKDCSPVCDWLRIERIARPGEPVRTHEQERAVLAVASPVRLDVNERSARELLDAHVPSFFSKLTGSDRKQRQALEDCVVAARAHDERVYRATLAHHMQLVSEAQARARVADEQQHQVALEAHANAVRIWEWMMKVAAGVRRRDPAAYRAAFDHLLDLGELEREFETVVALSDATSDAVSIECTVRASDIVPPTELSLTASGKLSTRKMAEGTRNSLYQDHLCSTAIRLAREAVALLPIERVVVNMSVVELNTSTGHHEPFTLLAVHFTRTALSAINFEAIDPSDSMINFDRRMSFRKGSGFDVVEPITIEEQWVTSR